MATASASSAAEPELRLRLAEISRPERSIEKLTEDAPVAPCAVDGYRVLLLTRADTRPCQALADIDDDPADPRATWAAFWPGAPAL